MIDENPIRNTSELKRYKSELKPLVSYDPGIRQKRKFKGFSDAEGVDMLTRSALIAEVKDFLLEKPDSKLTFFKLDIADLNKSDLTVDEDGNHAADLVLNKFAKELIEKSQGSNSMVCRYGGDEFVIAVVGEYDSNFPIKYRDVIEDYYKTKSKVEIIINQNGRIIKKPIKLKDDTVEIISRPDEPYQRFIFDYYMDKNLILNDYQIKQIIKKYKKPDEFIAAIGQLDSDKDSLKNSISKRIALLNLRYPELKLNNLISNLPDEADQKEIIRYIEKRKLDSLLGEVVYSSSEFSEKISSYDKIACLDMKFVKEINEIVSYVEGDKIIISLWKEIKNALGEDIHNIEIARRGGTFYFGLKKDVINGYLILEKLKKINKVSYLYAANHQADIKINYNVLSIKEKDIYKLSELDAGAENKFYDYIIGYLSRKAEEDPRYYNYHKVFPIGLFNPQSLLLNKIINSFFISKRADIRSSKIIERLKDDRYKQPGFDRIREIMKKLYNLSQLPEYQANSRVDHIENALRDFIYLPAKKSR